MNLVEHVKAEIARLDVEREAAKRALAALQPNEAYIQKVSPGVVPPKRSPNRDPADKVKRGPDSEITKAKKRIASAKRYGKEPAEADVDMVQNGVPR